MAVRAMYGQDSWAGRLPRRRLSLLPRAPYAHVALGNTLIREVATFSSEEREQVHACDSRNSHTANHFAAAAAMSLTKLSPSELGLLNELREASGNIFFRGGKVVPIMERIAESVNPAMILPIIGFLLDRNSAVVHATEKALSALHRRLPADKLPALDESMRFFFYAHPLAGDERWSSLAPDQVRALVRPNSALCALLLGLATCHRSGYVRRDAVARLDREVQSGEEIPFLLLRLSDWVLPVREQAEAAVARRLNVAHTSAFRLHLGLVERLRTRHRMSESPTLPRIESLLQSDPSELLKAALAANGHLARRYGLHLVWQAVPDGDIAAAREVVKTTLRQAADQALRLQVVRWLVATDGVPVLSRPIMTTLLRDRSPALRRLALGWCMAREPDIHWEFLRSALLDHSSCVRAVAQFYLPKLESFDLREFYRERVMNGPTVSLVPALGGLAQVGRREDAAIALPFVQAPRVVTRKAALAVLAKLAGCTSEYLHIFVAALQDCDNPSISRQARAALEPCAADVGAEKLAAIYFSSLSAHVRRQTLSLISRLPKWQRVSVLVDIAGRGNAEDDDRRAAQNFLRDWLKNYNLSYTTIPTGTELVALADALTKHRSRLDRGLSRELQGHVDFGRWT